uniref:Uncharacterized protein n=1 Tax=Lepeophtheirus salmonis TaxID=72036 RepID=A0A0K2UHH8_LEPSM
MFINICHIRKKIFVKSNKCCFFINPFLKMSELALIMLLSHDIYKINQYRKNPLFITDMDQ